MLSNESLHSPAFSRSNSQASVDSASMEDFWREIESIKEHSLGRQEEQSPAEAKPIDGSSNAQLVNWKKVYSEKDRIIQQKGPEKTRGNKLVANKPCVRYSLG